MEDVKLEGEKRRIWEEKNGTNSFTVQWTDETSRLHSCETMIMIGWRLAEGRRRNKVGGGGRAWYSCTQKYIVSINYERSDEIGRKWKKKK